MIYHRVFRYEHSGDMDPQSRREREVENKTHTIVKVKIETGLEV